MKRDDRGSLPLAMLIIVVSVGLSAVLASVVSSSVLQTRSDVQSVRATAAAQAGLNLGVAQIMRAGPGGITNCALTSNGPDGQVSVTIGFYATDPAAPTDPAVATCPFDPRIHRYAVLTVTGDGVPRTLSATYAFPVGDLSRPPGGAIRSVGTAGACLSSRLVLVNCEPATPDQSFVYGTDLTLSQVIPATLVGSCLRAYAGRLTMVVCQPDEKNQQWVWNGRTFVNVAYLNSCVDVPVGGQGAPVTLTAGASCLPIVGAAQTWRPDPAVGAGYAGSALSLELVNGDDFGRCLSAEAPVVLTLCGQTVVPLISSWIAVPVLGTTLVTLVSGGLCLTTGPDPGVPSAVTVELCLPGNLAQRWTPPQRDDTWADSFRIQDTYGRCLAASAATAVCDDSRGQKWNADPKAFRPLLTNITER